MKFNDNITVYGDTEYRGPCPLEEIEQQIFFSRIRQAFPATYGCIAMHPKNEGKRHGNQSTKDFMMGLALGASDIIIPARLPFICELKRRDHTKSQWQSKQIEYLEAAQACGAFVCVALGAEAALEAFKDWLKKQVKYVGRK